MTTRRSTIIGNTHTGTLGPSTPKGQTASLRQSRRPNYRAFDAALANIGSAPVDVVFLGDSITTGALASTLDKRWISLARDALRAQFQPYGVAGGLGYVQCDTTYNSPWTLTGVTAWSAAGGLGEGARSLPVAATAAMNFTGTALDVYYGKTIGGGTLTVSVDGAGSGTGFATINTANASQVDSAVVRVGGLAPGNHTLLITSSVAASVLEGVMIYNGDETKGLRIWDGGRTGIPTTDYITNPRYLTAITAIQPSLVSIMLGTNDYRIPKPLNQYGSNLVAIMQQVRAACTYPPTIQLVMPYLPDPGSATLSFNQFYKSHYQAASIIGDVDVIDLYNAAGLDIQTNTLGLLSGDLIHPTDKGHQFIADLFVDAVAPATWRPQPSRLVTAVSVATTADAARHVTEYVYFVSGTTTLTLPTAVANDKRYVVKNTGTNTATVATTSSQTIDGSTTATLTPNTALDLISDGANWRIV